MLWVKEKLMVTSNFSFSHNVFKRLVLQTCKNQGFLGKGLTGKKRLNSLPKDKFLYGSKFADDNSNTVLTMEFVFYRIKNIVGEGENVGYQHFLLFPQCFKKPSVSGRLTLSQTILGFHGHNKKPLETTVVKGENTGNQHFLTFQQCFLSVSWSFKTQNYVIKS